MALGKIVVSTSGPHPTSVEQLIIDGENGFLASVDDEESLFKKIVEAVELSADERARIGRKAQERVAELTPDKVYERMMEVYTDTIEKFQKRKHGKRLLNRC